MVVDLGCVDFDLVVSSTCPHPQPILTKFQLPKQIGASYGISQVLKE